MNIADRIRKLMRVRRLTQVQLGNALGVHPSSIANYLYGQRDPDRLTCLLLAGLAGTEEDRRHFLAASKLTDGQLALIEAAVRRLPPRAASE